MSRDQNQKLHGQQNAQGSRVSGSGYQSYKVQAEQYNNYISNEEVKMAPGSSQVKKRNMVQQSSHSHNVNSSASAQGVNAPVVAQHPHGQQAQSQAVLDKREDIDSDGSDFEEPPDQRAILHVLQNLPGISATDSRSYRIEALRVHLENQLGDQAFIEAYRHLVVSDLVDI